MKIKIAKFIFWLIVNGMLFALLSDGLWIYELSKEQILKLTFIIIVMNLFFWSLTTLIFDKDNPIL